MNYEKIIVDVQGFKNCNNQFLVKELSLVCINKECSQTFLIKPPYSYHTLSKEEKQQVRWLEKSRGILWSEGYIDYNEFKRIIKPYLSNKKILTKGTEKIMWIKDLCSNSIVIDLGEKGCPNLNRLYDRFCKDADFNCIYHSKQCAFKNVLCLKKWYSENNMELFL